MKKLINFTLVPVFIIIYTCSIMQISCQTLKDGKLALSDKGDLYLKIWVVLSLGIQKQAGQRWE
jgi:hypothetical protein